MIQAVRESLKYFSSASLFEQVNGLKYHLGKQDFNPGSSLLSGIHYRQQM